MSKALIFSGQGSQYVGMLKDYFDNSGKAKGLIKKADEILGFELSKICFEGPLETLKETRYTQPAVFLHSAVIFELFGGNYDFDATAGHSVGEYAALFASGVLSFEDALKIVAKRGQLMFDAGKDDPGTMFAVIKLDDEKVEEVCNGLNTGEKGKIVVPANYNSPGQIVVSGSRDYLRESVGKFKEAGARIVKELVVSGAFHSPLMQPAKEELEKIIDETHFSDAAKPVYSNVYAKPLSAAADIKQALILQLTSPVKWTQSVKEMQNNGINQFIEMGPGNVLQGLVKRTLSDAEVTGIDKFEEG